MNRRRPQILPLKEQVSGLQADLLALYHRLTPAMRDAAKEEYARLTLAIDGSAERELVRLQKVVDEKDRLLDEAHQTAANLQSRLDELSATAPTAPAEQPSAGGQAPSEGSGDGGGSVAPPTV